MNNLFEKLNKESDHLRLTHAEKNAMREKLFGSFDAAPAPRRVGARRSPYLFMAQPWMRALAALVLAVFAGTGTALASQGALPGQPLYAVKTNVLEPIKLALASTPAAKASVNAQLANERVAEAEALAQRGSLDATTSAQLADSYEAHAQQALAFADEASSTDPGAVTEVRTQLAVSSSVGSQVLLALGNARGEHDGHAAAIAARVLALADTGGQGDHAAPVRAAGVQSSATVRTMAFATGETGGEDATTSFAPAPKAAVTAAANFDQQKAATQLSQKAQSALVDLRAQFAAASSTLDATTTVSIETQLAGIDTLIQSAAQAANDSLFDTAVQDYTAALSRALRLSALLSAQQKFDHRIIDPLIKQDGDRQSNDSAAAEVNL